MSFRPQMNVCINVSVQLGRRRRLAFLVARSGATFTMVEHGQVGAHMKRPRSPSATAARPESEPGEYDLQITTLGRLGPSGLLSWRS